MAGFCRASRPSAQDDSHERLRAEEAPGGLAGRGGIFGIQARRAGDPQHALVDIFRAGFGLDNQLLLAVAQFDEFVEIGVVVENQGIEIFLFRLSALRGRPSRPPRRWPNRPRNPTVSARQPLAAPCRPARRGGLPIATATTGSRGRPPAKRPGSAAWRQGSAAVRAACAAAGQPCSSCPPLSPSPGAFELVVERGQLPIDALKVSGGVGDLFRELLPPFGQRGVLLGQRLTAGWACAASVRACCTCRSASACRRWFANSRQRFKSLSAARTRRAAASRCKGNNSAVAS